jgi:hypothetical protein
MKLWVLSLLAPLAATCRTDLDCELLGSCDSGSCHCSPGFTGPTCGTLDVKPVPAEAAQVFPSAPGSTGWSFAPVYDPATNKFRAVAEVACGSHWDSEKIQLVALSSTQPDRGWALDYVLGPLNSNSPHLIRAPNGTFILHLSAGPRANESASGACLGTLTPPPAGGQRPRLRNFPWAPECAPAADCMYAAATDDWEKGAWSLSLVSVRGAGWNPYNKTLPSIGMTNPSAALLSNGEVLLAFRSHWPAWPSIHPSPAGIQPGGEHMGFGIAKSYRGPFPVVANLSWEYGNDEDEFVWQQPAGLPCEGSLHVLYHNGRGKVRSCRPPLTTHSHHCTSESRPLDHHA